MKRLCIGVMLVAMSALVLSCRGASAKSINMTVSGDDAALVEATTSSLSGQTTAAGGHMASLVFELVLFGSMGLGATILLARRKKDDSSSRTALF